MSIMRLCQKVQNSTEFKQKPKLQQWFYSNGVETKKINILRWNSFLCFLGFQLKIEKTKRLKNISKNIQPIITIGLFFELKTSATRKNASAPVASPRQKKRSNLIKKSKYQKKLFWILFQLRYQKTILYQLKNLESILIATWRVKRHLMKQKQFTKTIGSSNRSNELHSCNTILFRWTLFWKLTDLL